MTKIKSSELTDSASFRQKLKSDNFRLFRTPALTGLPMFFTELSNKHLVKNFVTSAGGTFAGQPQGIAPAENVTEFLCRYLALKKSLIPLIPDYIPPALQPAQFYHKNRFLSAFSDLC